MESETIFMVYFLFTSMCVLLLIVGILKIKYYKSDNSTTGHVMNYTIGIVTASPFLLLLFGGFFAFYCIASATHGFVNSPLCSEKEGLKPHLLLFGILVRCFFLFVCFDALIN